MESLNCSPDVCLVPLAQIPVQEEFVLMIWKQGRRPSRLSRLQSSGAAGPAERGGVAILSLPSVQGDGSSDCPTPPLPELSRSLRCRGGERSKLSTPSKGPTPHPAAGCRGFWAGSSRTPLPPRLAHSRHLECLQRPCPACSWARTRSPPQPSAPGGPTVPVPPGLECLCLPSMSA